jgi:hypothetical protein
MHVIFRLGTFHLRKEVIWMALDPAVKKNWIEIQKQHDKPVNAIGVPIDPKDEATLKVWHEEGIDQFLKEEVTG